MFSRTVPIYAALLLSTAACATGFSAAGVSPEDIPRLERTVAEDSTDATAWTRLGVAYGMTDRADAARQALERAVTFPEAPAAAWAHLGTWREETDDLEGAADAYRSYLAAGGGSAEAAVESRLAAVNRELLAQRAREALATEEALTDEPADPATVGVLPLVVEGPEEYLPLGVGLADLLTTDLSITDRLSVVERAQMNALVEEMKLALGGFTDEASAARAGRLLRAGRLVQGRIAITEEDGQARVNALVLNATEETTVGEATEGGPLEALMDLEIRLALQIYRELGVELTEAERARLEEKPTRNLLAFLAYSEGLQLMDQGAYDAAADRFEAARAHDPGFNAARQAEQRAREIAGATTETVSEAATIELGELAMGPGLDTPEETALEQLVNSAVPAGVSTTATGGDEGSTPGETTTPENTETTAGTGVGQVVQVPIVLVRPRPSLIFWRIP